MFYIRQKQKSSKKVPSLDVVFFEIFICYEIATNDTAVTLD